MKKIMVVDNDVDHIQTVKQILEGADDPYEVICAGSGEKCLELLENNEIPDLILLDIMMPEMNGWVVFDRLKENPLWRNIPIVFLTACTDGVAKDAGIFLVEGYIEKPYDIDDLKKRIDKIVNLRGKRRSFRLK